jgi:hypothetical protein
MENKYDFPPPVDTQLFFGACALVATTLNVTKEKHLCNLSVELWEKMYEKLFGGFEDLSKTAEEDEKEIDELELIPASQKTKNGYLKDGFIIDDEDSASSGDSSIKKKKRTGGGKRHVIDSGSESEFVTETETESTTISTISGDSDGVNNSEDEPVTPSSVPAPPQAMAPVNAKIKLVKSSTKQKPKSKSKVEIVQNDDTDDELVEDEYE